MSVMDTYDVICNNCGRTHTTMQTGHIDCPHCGKRWIIEARRAKIVDPKNRKKVQEGVKFYLNGCKWAI